jgi:hypothetical protein
MEVGDTFDTPFEKGCVVVEVYNDFRKGSFLATDSDGVLCQFHVDMVIQSTIRKADK